MGCIIGTSVLRSQAKAGGIPWSTDYFAMATPEVEDKIRRAHKAFKVVKHTPDHRSTWIAGVIAAQAQAHNRSKASIWKQHNALERIRRTARTIRTLLAKEAPRKALSIVICPDSDGGRRECTEKHDLEAACLAEAGRHFTQVQHTPFLTEPLLSIFGETGTKKREFRQVLEGTFKVPATCDRLTQQFLLAVRRPRKVQEVTQRSETEYLQGWRKARESTSSSMSGIHFGHYIAGTFNPEILIINRTMADIPLTTGYSPDRWKHGLNVLLEKVPGNVNIEKLRIILLFEADFNANNKWIGRAVMQRAEECSLLAPEQYGSRNRKSAIIQCLNKCLFYDLLRFHCQPAALCSNDAKSCYDRITLLAAALCLCRMGATIPAVTSMVDTLHGMQNHVRTTHGDSSQAKGRKQWNSPTAGIGQGNGAGPSIWAAVSSPMFDVMRQEGFYALLTGAISLAQHQCVGFAFVDDTDLCVTHPTNNSDQVHRQMQALLTCWEHLLKITGGALVPAKCFWYLINFAHDRGKWRYQNCNQSPGFLAVHDDMGCASIIP